MNDEMQWMPRLYRFRQAAAVGGNAPEENP